MPIAKDYVTIVDATTPGGNAQCNEKTCPLAPTGIVFQRLPSPRSNEHLYRCIFCGTRYVATDIFMSGVLE